MNSRLYFLLSFAFLSACMPTQKPESDAFIQSELMPPKEEITIVEEPAKDNDRSILEEILAAIKSPSVVAPQQTPPPVAAPQQTPPPVAAPQQTPPPAVQPQPVNNQQTQPINNQTPPPVVLPQPSANIMPQILQAAPNGNGGGSPFFQTIVLPQMAPFAYPTPMYPQAAAPVAQPPLQPAPFYSTPSTQTQNQVAQAPTQSAPVQPVQQPQPAPQTQPVQPVQQAQPVQPIQQAQPVMEQVNSYVPTNDTYQQPQTYIPYVEPQYSNDFYPTNGSAEVILPDTYQLPEVQQIPANHVMSGQEAYPIWQSDNEVYYEEIVPAPTATTSSPSLQSENINIPRW